MSLREHGGWRISLRPRGKGISTPTQRSPSRAISSHVVKAEAYGVSKHRKPHKGTRGGGDIRTEGSREEIQGENYGLLGLGG